MYFGLSHLDLAALGVFLALWGGYTVYADKAAAGGRTLMTVMHGYRVRWMRRMLERDLRMQDIQALATQMRSVSLFASTTIFILGGLVALFGAADKARAVIADVPFAVPSQPGMFEVKLFGLLLIFVYAFFKFAWSLRQFNYALSVVGAAPLAGRDTADIDADLGAERMARIATLAVNSFNRGVRAYYFALAMLSWFVHPVAFVVATALVIGVIWRREFRSHTLQTLADAELTRFDGA